MPCTRLSHTGRVNLSFLFRVGKRSLIIKSKAAISNTDITAYAPMNPVTAINIPPSKGPIILPALLLIVSSDMALANLASPDKSSMAVRREGSSITLAVP